MTDDDFPDKQLRRGAPDDEHLDDVDIYDAAHALAGGTDLDVADDAREHMERCLSCSQRVQELIERFGGSHASTTFSESERVLADLRRAAAASESMRVLPDGLVAAINGATADHEVTPGSLWRLVWGGRANLVAVVRKHRWWVLVAPVTTDVDLADNYTAVFEPDESDVDVPLAVWTSAAATVPLFTFAGRVGTLGTGSAASRVAEPLWQLVKAGAAGVEPDAQLRVGMPMAPDDLDRTAVWDALVAELAWFSSAAQEPAPVVSPSADSADQPKYVSGGRSPDHLSDLRMDPDTFLVTPHHGWSHPAHQDDADEQIGLATAVGPPVYLAYPGEVPGWVMWHSVMHVGGHSTGYAAGRGLALHAVDDLDAPYSALAHADHPLPGTLFELVRNRLDRRELIERTGWDAHLALGLTRRGARVRVDQAPVLARALSCALTDVLWANAPLPATLLECASHPRLRRDREQWAARHRHATPEAAVWELVEHVYESAARTTTSTRVKDVRLEGGRSADEWAGLVHMLLYPSSPSSHGR